MSHGRVELLQGIEERERRELKEIYKTMLLLSCALLLVSVCGAAYREEYSKGCFRLLLVILNLWSYKQVNNGTKKK